GSVNETAGTFTGTLTRTGGTTGAFSVTISAAGGTAVAGGNYSGLPGTGNFADGPTPANFSITILPHHLVPGNLSLHLALSSPTNGVVLGSPSAATLTIVDTDTPPVATGQVVVVSGQPDGTAQAFAPNAGGMLSASGSPLSPFGGPAVNLRAATADVN